MNAPMDEKSYSRLVKSVETFNKTVGLQHAAWQGELDEAKATLDFLENNHGFETDPQLILKPGERLLGKYAAGLIEERAGQSRYVGGHSGISIPIGSIGGHSIRYSVGGSRGHIERGAPVETQIDQGFFAITNQRLIFVGGKQTRESELKKLVSLNFPFSNRIVISVSNRQKATVLSFDAKNAKNIRLMLLMANADAQNGREALIASAKSDIAQIETEEPKLIPVPTREEAFAPNFVPPVALTKAFSKLDTILLWVGTALGLFTDLIPILQLVVVGGTGYIAWKIWASKPAKKTGLIVATVILALFAFMAITNIAKGQILAAVIAD